MREWGREERVRRVEKQRDLDITLTQAVILHLKNKSIWSVPAIKEVGKIPSNVIKENGDKNLEIHAVTECVVWLKRTVEISTKNSVAVPRQQRLNLTEEGSGCRTHVLCG